jgi:hypothetical protein
MSYVGINVGALTVKVVAVRANAKDAKTTAHQGRPLEVLEQLLADPEFADAEYFGVSGHLAHIAEFAAIQRALREVGHERAESGFDAVASLGGESFLVYTLTKGRVTNVLSDNKCAAGSGEFFVQLIGRMGLEIDPAIDLSFSGKVVPLASRCTVRCKSDVIHKLNRHEASAADILRTLQDSMASKVVALLEKGQTSLRRVLLIGGVTRNAALLEALPEKLRARNSSSCLRVRGLRHGSARCSPATIPSTNSLASRIRLPSIHSRRCINLRIRSRSWPRCPVREIPWTAPGSLLQVISLPASVPSSWMESATSMQREESSSSPSI